MPDPKIRRSKHPAPRGDRPVEPGAHPDARGRCPTLSLRRRALLFLAPLLVRAAAWLELRDDPFFRLLVVDARTYHEAAARLAGGLAQADLPFWQPPLYPHILGALYAIGGPNPDLARWLQILLGSLTCVLLFRLGSRFFGRRAGWIAWGMAALYGPFIYFDLQVLNATLGLFLMLLALERVTAPGASRRKSAALGGLALGLAGLAVASLLVVAPVLGFMLFHNGRSPRRVVPESKGGSLAAAQGSAWILFLVACALPVLGITAWNWAGSGEPVVISYNGGVNFWIGNNPDYDATVALRPGRAWREVMQRPVNSGVMRPGETSGWWYREACRWIREEPVAWGGLLLKKTRLLLRGDEIYRNQEIYPFRERSAVLRGLLWVFGPAFPFGFLLPLAGAGAVLLLAREGKDLPCGPHGIPAPCGLESDSWSSRPGADRRAAILLLAMTAALGLSVIAFFVTSRYRLPMIPMLILLAAGGWARAGAIFARRECPIRALIGSVVLVVLFPLSNMGLPSMPRSFNSDTYSDMGTDLFGKGDLSGAAAQYARALELDPRNAEAAHNLGGVLLRLGRLDEADRRFRDVLDLHPGDLNALRNLGAAAFYMGDLYKSGWYYTQAVRLHPGSAEARSDLEGLTGELRRREAARLRNAPEALIDSLRVLARAQPENEFLLRRIMELGGAE